MLRDFEILEYLKNGESQQIKFKCDLVRNKSLAKELGALANSDGGMLFLGVDDVGEIKGLRTFS